ncbi:type II toxin-antitoxin system RelB/DinJ family antitoxin [Desulfoscipio gibsoniae]|uniref:Addiction module antitoxin, RelB/DinJ family n=1 Tax=Desulfoscipio gibsoniae DSM 7213 TaxID=767817 RepID=R4KFE4_9FIRM|nr:type II toxin-antitoxin system RelB/DinJ family antitoxin [Desulfoscipio gibsoniae]AGL00382.1 addiction module antitoxin, RelB/DinJ family [Desulfoscipio gibsoniae DSM 7213]
MARSSLIQIRVDDALKKDAEALFNDLGLDMPTAIRLFLKQSLLHNGIPFAIVRTDDFYNDYNLQVLKKSIQQLEHGKGTTHELIEAGDE